MKYRHASLVLCLVAALGCSNPQDTGDMAPGGEDLTTGTPDLAMSSPDLTTGAPDLVMGGDMKELSCSEIFTCIVQCRATMGTRCEETCLARGSTDAQLKFGVLALCLVQACPSMGMNAPCAMQSSPACATCVTRAVAAGGMCRTQAVGCGL